MFVRYVLSLLAMLNLQLASAQTVSRSDVENISVGEQLVDPNVRVKEFIDEIRAKNSPREIKQAILEALEAGKLTQKDLETALSIAKKVEKNPDMTVGELDSELKFHAAGGLGLDLLIFIAAPVVFGTILGVTKFVNWLRGVHDWTCGGTYGKVFSLKYDLDKTCSSRIRVTDLEHEKSYCLKSVGTIDMDFKFPVTNETCGDIEKDENGEVFNAGGDKINFP